MSNIYFDFIYLSGFLARHFIFSSNSISCGGSIAVTALP
jgi:hypothetical protein